MSRVAACRRQRLLGRSPRASRSRNRSPTARRPKSGCRARALKKTAARMSCPGAAEHLPLEAAPGVGGSWRQRLADSEALGLLVGVIEQQRAAIPGLDHRHLRRREARWDSGSARAMAALPPIWSEWQCVLTSFARPSARTAGADASRASVSGTCGRSRNRSARAVHPPSAGRCWPTASRERKRGRLPVGRVHRRIVSTAVPASGSANVHPVCAD